MMQRLSTAVLGCGHRLPKGLGTANNSRFLPVAAKGIAVNKAHVRNSMNCHGGRHTGNDFGADFAVHPRASLSAALST